MKLNKTYLVNYNFNDETPQDAVWQERFGHFALLTEGHELTKALGRGEDPKKIKKIIKKTFGVDDEDIVFYATFDHDPSEAEFKREMAKEDFIIHSVVEG